MWQLQEYRPAEGGTAPAPPGHLITTALTDVKPAILTLVSDGSVHREQQVATCAWVVHQQDGRQLQACVHLEPMTSLSSYRSELEGIFRGLHSLQFLGLSPALLKQWCDSTSAVDGCNKTFVGPSALMAPDADVLMAIRLLRRQLSVTQVICRHIRGHQDTRQMPSNVSSEDDDSEHDSRTRGEPTLSLPARLNVLCDRLANETAAAVLSEGVAPDLPPVLSLPYAGSRALLKIGGTWVTSQYRTAIHAAHWDGITQAYCCKKYHWSDEVFHSVDWDTIGSVRRKLTPAQFTRTSKIMHDWLPVMHMQAHMTGNAHCPGCPHPDETLDHMFRCRNVRLVRLRASILTELGKKTLRLGIPRVVRDALLQILWDYTSGSTPVLPRTPCVRRAVESQLQIGIRMFPRGFLSLKWTDLLTDLSIPFPMRKMAGFLKLLWLDFVEPLWRARNKISHQRANLHALAEAVTVTERLSWYLDNPHVISHGDQQQFLTYTRDSVALMTPFARATLIRDLDTVRALFVIENQQRASGQSFDGVFSSGAGHRVVGRAPKASFGCQVCLQRVPNLEAFCWRCGLRPHLAFLVLLC